jgi:hypothetical protein
LVYSPNSSSASGWSSSLVALGHMCLLLFGLSMQEPKYSQSPCLHFVMEQLLSCLVWLCHRKIQFFLPVVMCSVPGRFLPLPCVLLGPVDLALCVYIPGRPVLPCVIVCPRKIQFFTRWDVSVFASFLAPVDLAFCDDIPGRPFYLSLVLLSTSVSCLVWLCPRKMPLFSRCDVWSPWNSCIFLSCDSAKQEEIIMLCLIYA